MTIAILATDNQWEELTTTSAGCVWIRYNSADGNWPAADAYMLLQECLPAALPANDKPIYINAVAKTLQQYGMPPNVLRINGWKGFIQRTTWEIAGIISKDVKEIMLAIEKKIVPVADQPGLVAGRIIAMIINEGYFALGEKVSTKAEIDTAMKLGTNYPFGPFEWSKKIGIKNVYSLLSTLSATHKRYEPSELLKQEAEKQ